MYPTYHLAAIHRALLKYHHYQEHDDDPCGPLTLFTHAPDANQVCTVTCEIRALTCRYREFDGWGRLRHSFNIRHSEGSVPHYRIYPTLAEQGAV